MVLEARVIEQVFGVAGLLACRADILTELVVEVRE